MNKRKIWRSILLILMVFSFSMPLSAQESTQDADAETTEEPLPEELYLVSSRLLFPGSIQFQLVVEIPASQLVLMQLTVNYPGQEASVLNINPQEANVTTPYTDYSTVWDVSTANPPRLFDTITYQWRVVSQDNRIIDYTGTILYVDKRAEWDIDLDPDERLNFTMPVGSVNVTSIRRQLNDFYSLLEEKFGTREPFNILLYPMSLNPGCDLNETNEPVVFYHTDVLNAVLCDLELANSVYKNGGYIVLRYDTGAQLQSDLMDLIFARFYDSVWQDADVPAWFSDALKRFYQPSTKSGLLGSSLQYARLGQVFDAEIMAEPPTEKNQDVWDAQSYGMLIYTTHLIGVDALFELAETIGPETDFNSAFEAATGVTVGSMIGGWRNWIFTPDAQSVYGYTPFMSTTSTPTATLSPTLPPPTETFTPTLTPSVTGVLSATPSSTPTASRTPIPPTATATARRVSPFVIAPTTTPLPTAIPPSTTTDQPFGTNGMAIIGGVLVLGAVIGFFLLNRIRK